MNPLFSDPVLKVALAILVVLLGAVFFWQPLKMTWSGATVTNDFVLETGEGALDTKLLRGKVLVIAFGHADCDAACTERLGRLAKGYALLGAAERSQVKMIVISANPEKDTPARMAQFAKAIHPDIVGATGKPADVKAVTDAFAAEPRTIVNPDGTSALAPSPLTCIVNAEGRFVSVLNADVTPEKFAAAIRGRLPSVLPPGK